jgi:hypothetical protein
VIVREDPDGSVPVSQACPGTSTTGVVRVAVPAGGEADLAADALWRAGAIAIEERETPTGLLLVAGVAAGADLAPLLEAVDGSWPAEVAAVDVDAALDAWRTFARAVSVGERLRVRPPWVPAGSHRDSVDVVIMGRPGWRWPHSTAWSGAASGCSTPAAAAVCSASPPWRWAPPKRSG